MNEEFYKDLENFKSATEKFTSWAEIKDVGTMTFMEGMRDAFEKVRNEMKEMEQWFL